MVDCSSDSDGYEDWVKDSFCEDVKFSYYGGDDDDSGCDDYVGDGLTDNDPVRSVAKVRSIQVITRESLLAAQKEELKQVMELLALKEHYARTLLIHFRWDIEKVLTVFVEHGKDNLFAQAGLMIVNHDTLPASCLSSVVSCSICFEEMPANEVSAMDCRHNFCNDCWRRYLTTKINDGRTRRFRCMEYDCNAICNEAKVRELLNAWDPRLAEKFDRILLESYIEDNRRVKWCPSVPHCGNAIRVEDDELCEVECTCGHQFCFGCSSVPHSPCSCQMWKLWSEKCKAESESTNWLKSHTRPCPQCCRPVEKKGGCNHVVCICGQPFCWQCGGATGRVHSWAIIEGHSCSHYKEEHQNEEELDKKIELTDQHFDRYNYYYNRYKAHNDSQMLKFHELGERLQGKRVVVARRRSSLNDFSWLIDGLCRHFRCRQILSHSYVFAFYMFGADLFKDAMTEEERSIKKSLFEDRQQLFEANIEKFSMALEENFNPFSNDDITEFRVRVMTISAATDHLCRKMYEYIESDLLDTLNRAGHRIAPYMPNGI